MDKFKSCVSTGGGTGVAGILYSEGVSDGVTKEGCAGGQGSGGGYCIQFDIEGLDGGVLATGRPVPENIERLTGLLD